MDETYSSIMETGQVLDNTQQQLTTAANKLACTVQLLLLLIRWVGGPRPRVGTGSGRRTVDKNVLADHSLPKSTFKGMRDLLSWKKWVGMELKGCAVDASTAALLLMLGQAQ